MIDRTPYTLALKEKLDKSRWVQCGPKLHERVFVKSGYQVKFIQDMQNPGEFTVSVQGRDGQRTKMKFKDSQLGEQIEDWQERCVATNLPPKKWPEPNVYMTPEKFAERVSEHVKAQGVPPVKQIDPDEKIRQKYHEKWGQLPQGGFNLDKMQDEMMGFLRDLRNATRKSAESEVDIVEAAKLEKRAK